jgi:hypothetical protein
VTVRYLCVRDIDFAYFYDFGIGFWNCWDSVVFLELLGQCGIFRTVGTVWYFGTVGTVWYFGTVGTVWYFGTVGTVWYF